jgi:acyl-CoA thioesterase FadM
MWGLGLFFSVQFTFQYGLPGLLSFAIPNGLGLMIFGYFTQKIAKREGDGQAFSNFFDQWSQPYRLVFYLYQFLALTLTIFAIVRYLFQPLELSPPDLFLPLTVVIVVAAGCLFGEEFDINRIRFSHLVQFGILITMMVILVMMLHPFDVVINEPLPFLPLGDLNYWGYFIPICAGLLFGPWLDLQQWQRAIQMHHEKTSISKSYFWGGLIFFGLLLFHGSLALWAIGQGAGDKYAHIGMDGFRYAHDMITQLLTAISGYDSFPALAYYIFIGVCILTTLDSGYIALRWFLTKNVEASNRMVFSILPKKIFSSPIPTLALAGICAYIGAIIQFNSLKASREGVELEYFMVFFASFFVGYEAFAITRCFVRDPKNRMPQIKMFSMGCLSLVVFTYGYFLNKPTLMIVGSLLPLAYVVWLLLKELPVHLPEFAALEESLHQLQKLPIAQKFMGTSEDSERRVITTTETKDPSVVSKGYFDGNWFTYSMMMTYVDTNSVGNVYFGMYPIYVGKTRELFFNKVMPQFNLETTDFYILTRSFEHKFVRETKEFDSITVRICIGDFNRKFVTLEHEILNAEGELVGKGKQLLFFVSVKDYRPIDIPDMVHTAFLPYTKN